VERLPFCKICGAQISENAKFCPKCGASVEAIPAGFSPTTSEVLVVTTPTVPGFRVTKVFGVVTGLTPRSRGMLGKFIGGIQSMLGGEITAFTTEIEKARREAIERTKEQAKALGANAIIGLDMETSDLLETIIVISATGTAVLIEKEAPAAG
jgi:uncharacterized protein YbjQ (UPF0145 family)